MHREPPKAVFHVNQRLPAPHRLVADPNLIKDMSILIYDSARFWSFTGVSLGILWDMIENPKRADRRVSLSPPNRLDLFADP